MVVTFSKNDKNLRTFFFLSLLDNLFFSENPPVVSKVSVYPSKTLQAGALGSISSPNYPSNYGLNLKSELTLRVPEGNMMTMWVDSFDMECK